MKKETFTEKLIKRIYGISGPLDEHKRREADHIGNKVFMVLFYLMTLGNLIPFVLAFRYPQVVAFGYPIIIFLISMVCAIYVTSQTTKTGIASIDPDVLNQKEKKQLRNPGLKAGLIYGIVMLFEMPLLNILMDDSKSYLTALLNTRSILSTIVAAFFFGLTVHIVITLRIQKAREDQDDDQEETYEIITKFTANSYFSWHFYNLFLSSWPYYTSISDSLPVSSSCVEQGTEISENQIQKNTPSKRISLLYSRMLTTTLNEFYGLEISRISNHLHHFYSNLLLYSLSTLQRSQYKIMF